MSFVFVCPFCNQSLTCDDRHENQTLACPSCGEEIVPTKEYNYPSMPQRESPIGQRINPKIAKKTMKEYKVLTQKDQWFSGKFDPELLEQAINAYASQGWRVISAATASFPGLLSGNREEMVIIMERDK